MHAARVLVVDDHPLFREGLVKALGCDASLEVVGEAGSAGEALDKLATLRPDVVVVDVLLPDTSGITLASQIHERVPSCHVLGLSVIDETCVIADMLRASAAGFALKTQPASDIIDAIHHVLGGMRYLPPHVSRDAIDAELTTPADQPLRRLTPREREIFELLIRGLTNDEIATRLFIARRTVETHRQRIVNKLSAHSIPQLQRLAARYGGLTL